MRQKIQLPKNGKALQKMLIDTYQIQSGAALALVAIAAEALNSALEAEKLVEEHGRLIPGERGGLRANPMLTVSRDCRRRLLDALKTLNLEL